jgi:hypothetical protein
MIFKLLMKLLRKSDPPRTYLGCFSNPQIDDMPEDELSVNELEERAA